MLFSTAAERGSLLRQALPSPSFAVYQQVVPAKLAIASASWNPGNDNKMLDYRFRGNDEGEATVCFRIYETRH
jgi:hypothetical protein